MGAHEDVATGAPRRAQLEIGAVTAVELTPVHERPEAHGTARVHEVLQLVAGPPVAAGRDGDAAEDVEGVRGRVQQPLEVDFEVIAILPVAPEHAPLEPRRLPVGAPKEWALFVCDDIPARDGKREVKLPD